MKSRRLFAVERLESRDTPSGMLLPTGALAAPPIIRGYTDSNQFRSHEDPNQLRSTLLPAIQSPTAAVACPSDPSAR